MKSMSFWQAAALAIFAIGLAGLQNAQAEAILSPFEMLKKLDENRDNRLSEREFVGNRAGDARARARKKFRRLDEDGDRSLNLKELKRM